MVAGVAGIQIILDIGDELLRGDIFTRLDEYICHVFEDGENDGKHDFVSFGLKFLEHSRVSGLERVGSDVLLGNNAVCCTSD